MAQINIQAEFDAATTLDDKAKVLATHILEYRKNVRPRSLHISNCIFYSGFNGQCEPLFTAKERSILIEKVRELVSAELSYDYHRLESTNFRTAPENLESLGKAFNKGYLTSKKWQTQPVLFKKNVYTPLNLLPKRPIKFAETNCAVEDEQYEPIKVEKLTTDSLISNSTRFFYNDQFQFLYSTVTSLTFNPINAGAFCGTDPSKLKAEVLMDETLFEREVDVCTYVVPNGNPEFAVNLMRYDGTGYNHYNQVFYSEDHKNVFGEVAEVPHFHFQNNTENLIYTKKEKNDVADRTYSNAGCNAIDVDHLTNYLKQLDYMSVAQLESCTTDYGMPFLQAKKANIPMLIDIKNIIGGYAHAMNKSSGVSNEGLKYISKLYAKLNSISYNSESSGEVGHFDSLIYSLKALKLIHAELDSCPNKQVQFDLMGLEAVCAANIMETMSGKLINNNIGPDPNKNDNNRK